MLALGVLSAGATTAGAHAVLESSDPSAGATLAASPSRISLTFSERPDAHFSSIDILSTSGASTPHDAVHADGAVLSIGVEDLARGVYTVTWRVLSSVDGHVTGGAFAFGVGVSPSAADLANSSAKTVAPGPSALSVVGRWLFYAGLMLLLGFGWLSAAVTLRQRPGARWLSVAIAAIGAVAIAEAQRRSAGIGLGQVATSSVGRAFAWRFAPVLLAAGSLAWARGRARDIIITVAAALGIVAHVSFGHAGAAGTSAIAVAEQSTHFIAAGVWLGGLIALLAGLGGLVPDDRARAVRTYSTVALFAVVAIAGTGTLRALTEVGSWSALTSTGYGNLVLVKAGLLLALIVLGAINRFRHVPRAHASTTGLQRVARAELVVAAVVLIATGALSGLAPGRSSQAKVGAGAVIAVGSDAATTVRARLEVSPGGPGPNTFTLRLSDFDSRDPIDATASLRFNSAIRADVEPTTLVLEKVKAGMYRASGANLAFAGPWRVEVLAQRSASSSVVALTVFPRIQQRITEQPAPGQPTIYSVALLGGRAVQFYVEPGARGSNEVHATFFAPGAARTLSVKEPVLVATPEGGATQKLALRELSPGHFVAAATLAPGRWRFDVAARDGDVALSAFFEQTIAA
jgi:copper transport protein